MTEKVPWLKILRYTQKNLGAQEPRDRKIAKVEMIEKIIEEMMYERGKLLPSILDNLQSKGLSSLPSGTGISSVAFEITITIPPDFCAGWLLSPLEAKYERLSMKTFNDLTHGGDSEKSVYTIITKIEELDNPQDRRNVATASASNKFDV